MAEGLKKLIFLEFFFVQMGNVHLMRCRTTEYI